MDDILITNGSVKSIMQGETLSVSAGLLGTGYSVEELKEYEVSLRIYSKTGDIRFSTKEGAGDERIEWQEGGIIRFVIPGEKTRNMLGKYFIECKITKCGQTIVCDRSSAFEVVESRIGALEKL